MTHQNLTPIPRIAAVALYCLLLGALPAGVTAQDTVPLPVQIVADSAEMDDRRGVGTYTGNVVVTRGDLTLRADRIIIYTEERRPLRMEAEGNPVRAEAPDINNEPRIATSSRMEYTFDDETLLLLTNARLQTSTEDARGNRITYDLTQDIMRIDGTPTERVRITIQPRPE